MSTDPSSHLISFAYNRKSYVTANLGGSSHGEKEIESMDDQEANQMNDYHSIQDAIEDLEAASKHDEEMYNEETQQPGTSSGQQSQPG